jgi:predicted anti-sigma-YlaC factor YlaD
MAILRLPREVEGELAPRPPRSRGVTWLAILLLGVAAGTLGGVIGFGSSLMVGSWLAKRIVLGMEPARFTRLVEAVTVVAGLVMVASALWPR